MKHRSAGEVSQQALDFLGPMIDRGVPLLFLYGDADGAYAGFLEASTSGELADLLRRGGDRVEVAVVPGRLHGWVSMPAQIAAIEKIVDWVSRVDAGASRGSAPTVSPAAPDAAS
jgi:hypothetical protein